MTEPVRLTGDMVNTWGIDLPGLVQERRKATAEAEWQATLGGVTVDTSEGGLAANADAAAQMPDKPKASEDPAGADRERTKLDVPMVRQGVDTILKTLTGVGIDELEASVLAGTLPEKVSMRMLDPAGGTAEALAQQEAERAGLPPDVTAQVAGSAGFMLGILFPVGKAAKAGKKSLLFAKGASEGADPRIERLKRIFTEERGALVLDPQGGESRLNTARLDAPEPVKAFMENVNSRLASRLEKHREVQGHVATVAESRTTYATLEEAMKATVEELVLDKAKALRFRDFYNAVGTEVESLARLTVAGDPDAKAKLPDAFAILGDMAMMDEIAGATTARNLEARKILSDATRVDIKTMARERSSINRVVAEQKVELTRVQTELDAVKGSSGLGKAEQELERVEASLVKLEGQLDEAKASAQAVTDLKKQIADAKKEAEALAAQVAEAKQAGQGAEGLARELDRMDATLKKLDAQLAEAQEEAQAFAQMKAHLADETKLAGELKTQIAATRKEHPKIETLEAQVLRAQETVDELTQQLTDARETVQYAMGLAEERGFNVKTIAELRKQLRGVADADMLARRLLSLPRREQTTFAANVLRYVKAGNDVLHWAYLQSLLSNPLSHAANIVGTGAINAWHYPERYLSEWVGLVLRSGPEGVQRGETWAMMRVAGRAWSDGIRLMGRTLKTGEQPLGKAGMVEPRFDLTAAQFGLDPNTSIGKVADVTGMLTPTRLMMTEDAFYKGFVYRSEMAGLALREALAETPDGPDYAGRLARLVELKEAVPSPAMMRMAKEAALLRTLNAELGPAGKMFMAGRSLTPGLAYIQPFVQTPTNSYKWFHWRAPILNLLSAQNWKDIAAGGASRDLAVSRMLLGSAVGGAVAYHVLQGNITGGLSGGSNKNLRRDLKALGPQAYSIRVGDTYYYYKRTDPVGQYIGAIATALEIHSQLSERDPDNFDWANFAMAATLAGSRVALDTPWLSGLSDVLEAIERPDVNGKKMALGFARGIVPAGMRQLTASGIPGLMEPRPELRDLDGLVDVLKSGFFAFADDIPPVLHPITGDVIVRPPGWGPDVLSPVYVTHRKDDPVLMEVVTNRMSFSEPSRMYSGAGDPDKINLDPTRIPDAVRMNTHQFYRLKELATREIRDGQGRTMHEAMTAEVATASYQRATPGPDGGREVRLKLIYREFYNAARRRLGAEDATLSERESAQRQGRVDRLRPNALTPSLGR